MTVVCVIIAYLLGSISTSTLTGKWVRRIDIRQHGSGNAGATNTLRVLGAKWGVFVLLMDILKGLVAIWLTWLLCPHHPWVPFFAGLAVIVGHNWPVFFQFRGGKGVATTIGVLLLLLTVPALYAGVIAILALLVTRYVSLASLLFTVLTVVFVVVFHGLGIEAVFSALVALLSIYRHRENIKRLVSGTERKVFRRGGQTW